MSIVKWLLVASLCLLSGFIIGKFKQMLLAEKLTVLSVDLEDAEKRNNRLETALSQIQVSSSTDSQTIKSLINSNKQLQDELAIANNKLFFYERVVAPELEVTGVKVNSFDIVKNAQTQQWDYELVLMQSQKKRRLLNGSIDISFSVFEGESLKLVSISEFSESIENRFKFKYFQTIQGSFSLPQEITIDEVVLQLNVAGNRWYKAQSLEERYDWRVLTTQDIDDLSDVTIPVKTEVK